MRRIVIIANTYYQMIMAVQLNNTIFSEDEVILLMSDHSKNTDIICDRLNQNRVFAKAYYIRTKGLVARRNKWDKIVDFAKISFSNKNRYSCYLDDINDLRFNELICFNYSIDIYGLYSVLYNYNNNVVVSLYEEGVLSYGVKAEENFRRKIIKYARHLTGKKDITESFGNFYCFYPELYHGSFQPIKVPHIPNKGSCTQILKQVFELSDSKINYTEKYIFFTSVYDFEGGEPIGEYQLVCKVADLVGKDNLLIKTHPRDTRNIYEENGFKVDKNSSIPWEAIQMSADFSKKIFMTATSGSVLAGSFMAEKATRTYYMFKCCDVRNNALAQTSVVDITNLLSNADMKDVLGSVSILEKVNEIKNERPI